jgi:hypothetical protein
MKKQSSARVVSTERRTGRRQAVETAIALSKTAGRWQDHREAHEHQTPPRDDPKSASEPKPSDG